MRSVILVALVASAQCFGVGSPAHVRTRASSVMMGEGGKPNNTPAKFYPKGPFGGYEAVGTEGSGWLGDSSKGLQIEKFEKGEDFLFFQGPAPKTAVQEDLPSFFSADNFADLEITPVQIGVTGLGFATAAALLVSLVA